MEIGSIPIAEGNKREKAMGFKSYHAHVYYSEKTHVFSRAMVVAPTMILMSAGLFLYSAIDSTPMMLVSAVMIGIGFGLANPAILAGMLDRATPQLQGMAVAGFHLAYSLGLSISSPVFGAIAENVGYPPMWWISGGLTTFSVLS